jgi:hypothetical protein
MEFYFHNWLILQKATPWVAGKTIQIQYGVQVAAVNSISLDGGTETSSLD